MVLYLTCESFADRKFKMAAMTKLSLPLDPMGISHFHLLPLTPLNRFEPNLAEMLSRWSFTRFVKLVPIGNSTWPSVPIMCSDWSKFQTSSCLKLQSGLNCYFAEMIVIWSCTLFVNSLPIWNSRCLSFRDSLTLDPGNCTYSFSFQKPLNQFQLNFTESWFLLDLRFLWDQIFTWPSDPVMCFDYLKFQKYSLQKPQSFFTIIFVKNSCTNQIRRS